MLIHQWARMILGHVYYDELSRPSDFMNSILTKVKKRHRTTPCAAGRGLSRRDCICGGATDSDVSIPLIIPRCCRVEFFKLFNMKVSSEPYLNKEAICFEMREKEEKGF